MTTQYGPMPHEGSNDESDTDYIQILDDDGGVRSGVEVPDIPDADLLAMYETIVLARRFDQRAISLQRQGRIATYAPMTGQEGAQVATSYALAEDDWLFPTYREHAAKYAHGMSLTSILQPLYGHRDGYAIPEDVNVVPEYIPIATQVPQAVGKTWGDMLQGRTDRAALCHLGDGATSEGDFHEGLNFAGVFDVPTVFVCNNNQYAISTPHERQTASETMAEKAHAYNIEGVRVDGLDPLAVYEVTRQALRKAKNPVGDECRPTLVEAVLYRYGAHTTSDDPSVYRDEEEAELWRKRDPVDRLGAFLESRGILTDERAADIEERVEERIQAAIDEAEAYETEPDAVFEHVYETPPEHLERQRAELAELREKYGDDAFSEVLQ